LPNRSIATGSDAAHVRGIWAALSFYHSGATAWGRSSDKGLIEGVDAKVVDLLPEFAAAVFHVSEHLHACGRALYGETDPRARDWATTRLLALLRDGPVPWLAALQAERRTQRSSRKRRALKELINYLKPNVDGLWYRQRLARGLPIGSGLIEGACKTVVGKRLKHGGARWHVPRVENVAALRCLLYSNEWDAFWQADAA